MTNKRIAAKQKKAIWTDSRYLLPGEANAQMIIKRVENRRGVKRWRHVIRLRMHAIVVNNRGGSQC